MSVTFLSFPRAGLRERWRAGGDSVKPGFQRAGEPWNPGFSALRVARRFARVALGAGPGG